jgi:hypothetical protein
MLHRFYRGLIPALLQGPLSRFGDTAANTGTLAALDNINLTRDLPVAAKTVAASVAAAGFRIFLMPIDTFKTTMQVEGKDGVSKLMTKFRASGPTVFFHGSIAAASATFVGHYPWFFVYNYLSEHLPRYTDLPMKLARSALIGFCASAISDTCSNSIRVIKVYKQSSTVAITYPEAIKKVIAEDGLVGLFGRGSICHLLSHSSDGKKIIGCVESKTRYVLVWTSGCLELLSQIRVSYFSAALSFLDYEGNSILCGCRSLDRKSYLKLTLFDVSTGRAKQHISGYAGFAYSIPASTILL